MGALRPPLGSVTPAPCTCPFALPSPLSSLKVKTPRVLDLVGHRRAPRPCPYSGPLPESPLDLRSNDGTQGYGTCNNKGEKTCDNSQCNIKKLRSDAVFPAGLSLTIPLRRFTPARNTPLLKQISHICKNPAGGKQSKASCDPLQIYVSRPKKKCKTQCASFPSFRCGFQTKGRGNLNPAPCRSLVG